MKKRNKKQPGIKPPSLIIYAILLLLLFLGGAFWFMQNTKPVAPGSNETQVFVVKRGQGIDEIGSALNQAGLIRSPIIFKLTVAREGLSKKIQAGTFRLSPGMDASEVAKELTHGTLDAWVTVLEGWRREEIAAAIEQSFAEHNADFSVAQFLSATEGKEGYLFPDTYLFPLSASEETIASILESTFNQKIEPLQTKIDRSPYTLHQIVTLASLLEREANTKEDMKLVAGILYKRLEDGWPLQVDATLQYATGYDEVQDTWWKPPTASQKELNSPYNTYQNPGLPPHPIASPSLTAIEAALTPTRTDYYFYLTDTRGNMHYSETLEQHNQNVEQYLR